MSEFINTDEANSLLVEYAPLCHPRFYRNLVDTYRLRAAELKIYLYLMRHHGVSIYNINDELLAYYDIGERAYHYSVDEKLVDAIFTSSNVFKIGNRIYCSMGYRGDIGTLNNFTPTLLKIIGPTTLPVPTMVSGDEIPF